MTPDPTRQLVEYRLARARETLEEARLLLDADRGNAAVNRLYYASFYSVSALLLAHGHAASKHSHVRSLFGRHYVKPGLVSKTLGAFFNEIFDRRQEGDYEDLVRFDAETVRPWLAMAADLIAEIEKLANG